MSLRALLTKAAPLATSNVLLSAFNMGSTVLLVRWFGSESYADYVIDLAKLSLLALCLEIVPTSYSVFRAQDEPVFARGLAGVSIVSGLAIAALVALLGMIGHLQAHSAWISLYGFLLAPKRFLDVRLQSTGRLRQFLALETAAAGLRIVLMGGCLYAGISARHAVWASLAVANLVAQGSWMAMSSTDAGVFAHAFSPDSWRQLLRERRSYAPYYLGIALKRLRENIVPLTAATFFPNKNEAGTFFLAYRGLLFTIGQLRVFEGLLNYRKALDKLTHLPNGNKFVLACIAQVVCITASVVLALASGIRQIPWATVLILSFTLWFSVFVMLKRADAYSRYEVGGINLSIATYIVVAVGLLHALSWAGRSAGALFAGSLLMAEGAALYVLVRFTNRSADTPAAPTPEVLR